MTATEMRKKVASEDVFCLIRDYSSAPYWTVVVIPQQLTASDRDFRFAYVPSPVSNARRLSGSWWSDQNWNDLLHEDRLKIVTAKEAKKAFPKFARLWYDYCIFNGRQP